MLIPDLIRSGFQWLGVSIMDQLEAKILDNSVTEAVTNCDKEKIRKLEAQVLQMKNIIVKLTGQKEDEHKKKKNGRPFDFKAYKRRHVLLHVSYAGWNLHGFAVQEITGKTVESELFKALTLTKLIESRETSNYHRCGRTDKGVSAFHQVISIDLRSNLVEGPGVFTPQGCTRQSTEDSQPHNEREIDYCKIINANLSPEIQVVAWAPCNDLAYSARFNCVQRTYKYFFPKGDLDLDRINAAGKLLLGSHDFRNFCKMDVAHGVVEYNRNLTRVEAVTEDLETSPYTMCVLTIRGKAFLWHQVRCIVAVLFRVGAGKEEPEVVSELLDVGKNPRRPQYTMASEVPLNLFHVEYDGEVEWIYDQAALATTVRQYQSLWTDAAVKATMLKASLTQLEGYLESTGAAPFQAECLVASNYKTKEYVPLMQLQLCPALEEKLKSSSAKRRKVLD